MVTVDHADDVVVPIFDAATFYAERNIPLVIVAGKSMIWIDEMGCKAQRCSGQGGDSRVL